MSRSPWREALDGQIKILRELRRTSAKIHLARNADVPQIREAFPDDGAYTQFAFTFGETLAEGIETLVREAEPIYLAHDIHQAVLRQIDLVVTSDQHARSLDTSPLDEGLPPILHGLLTLPGSGLMLEDIPAAELASPRVQDTTDIPGGTVYIKAIYFGDEVQVEALRRDFGGYMVRIRAQDPAAQGQGLGVTIFLDSLRSGYDHMTEQFGEHLVPVPLGS